MDTRQKKSLLSYIPGYSTNAVLKVIVVSGVAYAMLGITWAVIMLVFNNEAIFNNYFLPNIALPHLATLASHWWTPFTYSWFHFGSFFQLLSDMLWFYCFGNVVQMLVGHRQIIPLFLYSSITGVAAYMLGQLLPGELGRCPQVFLGPAAAMAAMAGAAITLTPQYKFYLTDRLGVPMLVLVIVFFALMVLASGLYAPVLLMLAAGAGTGYGYIRMLRGGYRPGEWMYRLTGGVEGWVTPDEQALKRRKAARREAARPVNDPHAAISQKRIDDILDKINQKGYNSLSAEEKEILLRAGKEN